MAARALSPLRRRKSNLLEAFDWASLRGPVIGVDEVGRGCLAGPVYAAAVILKSDTDVEHYRDSKLLSESRRAFLSESIQRHQNVGLGFATAAEVDRFNILQATFLAMRRAIHNLGVETGHVLVDGNMRIPQLTGFEQTPLVKGDQRAAPISAASIVAKYTRDHVMIDLSRKYPHYGFEKHKGYGTKEHRDAIENHGPCLEHRRSFCGIGMFQDVLAIDSLPEKSSN